MNTYDDILEGIQTEALRGQLNDALKQYETFSDPAHGVQHIREVVDAARKIHAESGVDQEQLLTAAILHDIGRDVQFKGGEGHEIAGARLAKPYIGTFAPGVQRNILHAIRQHRTEGRPRTMLAKLVRDADKLPDKINPGSTFRRLAEYRLAQGYTDPKQIAEDARQYVLGGRASDNARLLTPQARALAAPMRAEIHELRRDPAGWYAAMLPYLKTSAEKDPRRWQTVIVKSPYASLTKQDVHDYYKTPTVQKQILDAVGKNEVIVRQSFTPKAIVLRRKNEAGELIKMPDAAALQTWNMKRLTEVHPTFGKKVDFVLADIDPQKGVPWSKTKSITETVAKTMTSHPRVKDVEVRFSGGRGFYVTGRLDGEIGVDSARSLTKRMLDGITKRPDVTFSEATHGQIRLDVSPLKYRGSVRAPYSLNAQTGLVSVPIALDKLPKVKKEDFTMNRALKGLIKNSAEFVPLIFGLADDIPAIMRMIHRNRVAASPYPHAVFPYPQEDPQQQVLKRAAAEFAPGIPKNKKIHKIPTAENQPWTLAVQKHVADKAGPHWDLRLVPGIGGHAHSWAVPKMKFPEPGKMQLAIQQPTHTADYALNFEGKIPKGTYGAGKVTMPIKEQVNIIKAGPDKVVFQRPNQDKYTLFRMGDTKWGITKSVKHAAEELYHGSTDSHDTLQPMPVPGLSGKKLLYAAPRRGVALAYTRRWSDNDLGQGFVSPDEPAYLTEMRPNAFKDIFEGQPGYLHTVPAETFRPLGDTAISGEHVSEKPVKATKVEHIADALQALKDSGVVLNEYDPTSVAFKQEMAGMKHRAANMKPADRKRYLGWRLRNSTKDVKDAWKAKEAAASVLDRVQKSEQSKRSTAFIRQRLRGL